MAILSSIPLQVLGLPGDNGILVALRIVVAGFAIILLVISLTAFRRSKARRLLLVSGAFATVVIRVLVVENATLLFPLLSLDVVDFLRGALDLVMLLLFFLAVIKS